MEDDYEQVEQDDDICYEEEQEESFGEQDEEEMEDEDLLQDGDLTATKLDNVLFDDVASKQSQEDLDD